MKQFFLEHYPDLVAVLGTSEGRLAVESVAEAWGDAEATVSSAGPGSSQWTAESVTRLLANLGTTHLQAASDAFVHQNLPPAEWEQLWIAKYEPRLRVAIQIAAAWVDWRFHEIHLDPSERLAALKESMSEAQLEAVREWSSSTGRALGQTIVERGEAYVIQNARASISEAVNAFSAQSESRRSILLRLFALFVLVFAPPLLGSIVGIVPGLLAGLVGWHQSVAIVLPIIWAIGYVSQRGRNYGDVDAITYSIAVLGGLGFGASAWVFGNIVS